MPRILGRLDAAAVTTEDDDRVLVLSLENLCRDEPVELRQLEVQLRSRRPIPSFVEASVEGVVGGMLTLPPPLDHAGPDPPGDVTTHRIRWARRAFCEPTAPRCDFPAIDPDAPALRLRLRFDASACAPLRVEAFNFRVPLAERHGELLCSERGSRDEAPALRIGPGRGDGPLALEIPCGG